MISFSHPDCASISELLAIHANANPFIKANTQFRDNPVSVIRRILLILRERNRAAKHIS